MMLVTGVDLFEALRGLLQRAEAEYALAVGQVRAGARVLHDRGLPARQVAQRAVAHPGVLEGYARRLGRTELPSRALDVEAIVLCAARVLPRVAFAPHMACQLRLLVRDLHGLYDAHLALLLVLER